MKLLYIQTVYAEIFEQISALNRISSHLMCHFPLFEYPLSFHHTHTHTHAHSHSHAARFIKLMFFFSHIGTEPACARPFLQEDGKEEKRKKRRLKTICSLSHQVISSSHTYKNEMCHNHHT